MVVLLVRIRRAWRGRTFVSDGSDLGRRSERAAIRSQRCARSGSAVRTARHCGNTVGRGRTTGRGWVGCGAGSSTIMRLWWRSGQLRKSVRRIGVGTRNIVQFGGAADRGTASRVGIRSGRLLSGALLRERRGCPHAIPVVERIRGLRCLRLYVIYAAIPICDLTGRCWRLRGRTAGGCGSSPLRTGRRADTRSLISLGMHVLRNGGAGLVGARGLTALEQLQTSLDVDIVGIKIGCTAVCVEGIGGLVVAGLILKELVSVVDDGEASMEVSHTRVPRSYHTSEM